jgi:hypothetical protein
VQVTEYLAAKAERKRGDLTTLHAMMLRLMPGALTTLHAMMLRLMPGARLWFLDGKDEDGRTLSDPSIGHGLLNKAYADGRARGVLPDRPERQYRGVARRMTCACER